VKVEVDKGTLEVDIKRMREKSKMDGSKKSAVDEASKSIIMAEDKEVRRSVTMGDSNCYFYPTDISTPINLRGHR
jgi:hypothetical protein